MTHRIMKWQLNDQTHKALNSSWHITSSDTRYYGNCCSLAGGGGDDDDDDRNSLRDIFNPLGVLLMCNKRVC